MIGLSTSVLEDYSGKEIVWKAKELGFNVIELAFRLRPEQVNNIITTASQAQIHIASLHNYVPEPQEKENGVRLSDIDESLRDLAIELTLNTMRLASDIGAQAVILHMGEPREWNWSALQRQLRQAIHDQAPGDDIDKIRQQCLEARKRLPNAYLDSMLLSLDKIAPAADALGIKLGIENRYSFGQFPNFEEMGILLQEFSGSSIGYWHDCGHAANNKYCGFAPETENIDAYGDRLVGIHLHDIHDWHDHQIPGPAGDIDFAYLLPHINEKNILVMELTKTVPHDQIRNGIEYLALKGIF